MPTLMLSKSMVAIIHNLILKSVFTKLFINYVNSNQGNSTIKI